MRILYIDIDSLRPDHLGCYGYPRATSPNIDRVAERGVRFENHYASDSPCLPSRTALWSGRFGFHNGVISHGGTAGDPFIEGPKRHFRSTLGQTSWMRRLRDAGLRTVTVSPFGERHSAWHWYANFSEVYNTGRFGLERADEIAPVAIDWIRRNGAEDDWFLHVNLWDPHTPYRAPAEFGDTFAGDPCPDWLTDEVRAKHWQECGPHSAQEMRGWTLVSDGDFPCQPYRADSMVEIRKMFDGYDTGIRYADEYVGRILNALADKNVLDDTAIIISADHGENLGELNIYMDHHTADAVTPHVPLILSWPGITHAGQSRVDSALRYNVDMAATTIELVGQTVPDNWDGVSFAPDLKTGAETGRDYLVVSQGAWSCQRSVRWSNFICIRTYHDAYHCFPDVMLFDTAQDPHEQHDLAPERPDLVAEAMVMLEDWQTSMMRTASHFQDPLFTVLAEGGPHHSRGRLPEYVKRLRATGREVWADELEKKHPKEL